MEEPSENAYENSRGRLLAADGAGNEAAPDARSDRAGGNAAGEAEALATVEAILFASDSPLTAARIAAAAELPPRVVNRAVKALNERYEQAGSAFAIEQIAGGFQMLTRPEYNDVLSRLLRAKSDSRLSQAAMEALAIVAYRQPIMRADIEAIRGVACGEVLRGLLDKGLVKIVGRAQVLGRPMLYGTTRRFLAAFGLASLDDLPRVEELRTGAPNKAAKEPQDAVATPAAPPTDAQDDADPLADDTPPADTVDAHGAQGAYSPTGPKASRNVADHPPQEQDDEEFDDDEPDDDEELDEPDEDDQGQP